MADLVQADKVTFSVRAERDYRELGYNRAQARECIAWIDQSEFSTSLRYIDDGKEWDVYITDHRGPDGKRRRLYIKLRIPSPSSADYVAVTSFHEEN